MPPISINRRRFLGCSAAVGLALAQGSEVEALASRPVRVGLIGLGGRGTTLLRTFLELPGVAIVAVGDREPKHRLRAQGIVEKAQRPKPDASEDIDALLARTDVDAVAIALPCDLHAGAYRSAIRAGKHLYAEKPLAPTLAECDMLISEAAAAPQLTIHVGHQRRSNVRYREAIELLRRGELGTLIQARASWVSSNGPVNGSEGWLSRRDRSGDWMVEQAVHVWDLFHWMAADVPARAYGQGRRDVFSTLQPERDVTDHYQALLDWENGFHASLVHSWIDPADAAFTGMSQLIVGSAGGIDLGSGEVTFRDRRNPRRRLSPGPVSDTKAALEAFVASVRSPEPLPPPITLQEARAAALTGLLVRRAVDERRVVARAELFPASTPA